MKKVKALEAVMTSCGIKCWEIGAIATEIVTVDYPSGGRQLTAVRTATIDGAPRAVRGIVRPSATKIAAELLSLGKFNIAIQPSRHEVLLYAAW